MKIQKLLPIGATVLLLSSSIIQPGWCFVCTNCSTVFVQLLDRITSLDQLATLSNQYSEALTQTTQQIAMVQNLLQNTMKLPPPLRTQLSSQLLQLSNLTGQLNTQRGDITALGQIYKSLFPSQSKLSDLQTLPPDEANKTYQEYWDNWSRSVDQASEATFQLSGQQLADLKDSGGIQDYINQLIATPEGQMQALQAGNQLASIQIQEARQLRELMATSAQSTLAAQTKAEKESEADKEWWRKVTSTGKYDFSQCDEPLP